MRIPSILATASVPLTSSWHLEKHDPHYQLYPVVGSVQGGADLVLGKGRSASCSERKRVRGAGVSSDGTPTGRSRPIRIVPMRRPAGVKEMPMFMSGCLASAPSSGLTTPCRLKTSRGARCTRIPDRHLQARALNPCHPGTGTRCQAVRFRGAGIGETIAHGKRGGVRCTRV